MPETRGRAPSERIKSAKLQSDLRAAIGRQIEKQVAQSLIDRLPMARCASSNLGSSPGSAANRAFAAAMSGIASSARCASQSARPVQILSGQLRTSYCIPSSSRTSLRRELSSPCPNSAPHSTLAWECESESESESRVRREEWTRPPMRSDASSRTTCAIDRSTDRSDYAFCAAFTSRDTQRARERKKYLPSLVAAAVRGRAPPTGLQCRRRRSQRCMAAPARGPACRRRCRCRCRRPLSESIGGQRGRLWREPTQKQSERKKERKKKKRLQRIVYQFGRIVWSLITHHRHKETLFYFRDHTLCTILTYTQSSPLPLSPPTRRVGHTPPHTHPPGKGILALDDILS